MRRETIVTLLLLAFGGVGSAVAQQTPGQQWDERFGRPKYLYGKEPVELLERHVDELRRGRALCLAAGEGRNAVFLAAKGYDVLAVDASAKGLEKARALAAERGVEIHTEVADLRDYELGREQYDLVTDFYYHQPDLFPKVMEALKPGGIFILQGFSIDQPATNRFGPRELAHLVKPNELLRAFAGYRIRYYADTVVELDEGMHQGRGAVVQLIVEKTPLP